MILKTIKKEEYEIEDSMVKEEIQETQYYDGITNVSKYLPLKPRDEKVEYITLHFKDYSEISLVLRTMAANVWIDNYKNVFLMNDKGETIERIV